MTNAELQRPTVSAQHPCQSTRTRRRLLPLSASHLADVRAGPAGASASIPFVIWLRRQIERGRRHPILGPLVIILLVLLLCFAAAHTTSDQAAVGGYVCVILGFLVFLSLLVPRPRPSALRIAALGRGPPVLYRVAKPAFRPPGLSTPLRL